MSSEEICQIAGLPLLFKHYTDNCVASNMHVNVILYVFLGIAVLQTSPGFFLGLGLRHEDCFSLSFVAEMQAQLGEKAVTGVVSMAVSDEGSETHFEAFQVRSNPFLS